MASVSQQSYRISGKWWKDAGSIRSVYRLVAFAIATAQITFSTSGHYSVVSPHVLVAVVAIYSLFKVLHPFRWHQRSIQSYSILGLDLVICLSLLSLTGGLDSPFLLYSLAPVLTAGLLLERKITFTIAGISAAHVFGSHLWNPFFSTQLSLAELNHFLTYMIALSWSAVLPYLINANLRQHLQLEDTLLERQRLSREIHDGAGQTVAAVRWQAELVERRLLEMGIDLADVRELVKLTARAHEDTRECLALLRNYTGDGSFVPHLKDYLEHLKQRSEINFRLTAESRELHLEPLVELQLLRICQEALINVTRHSAARNVQAKVQSVDGHLAVSIADDGCGFEAVAYYRDRTDGESQGLAVMRERAESIGGRLRVLSMPGQGTEIQLEVPFASSVGRYG